MIPHYRLKLSLFLRWCDENGIAALQKLTAHDLHRYLVHLIRRKLSAQYQNNLARAIRAFLNYCVRDELLGVSPFDKVQMPKHGTRKTRIESCRDNRVDTHGPGSDFAGLSAAMKIGKLSSVHVDACLAVLCTHQYTSKAQMFFYAKIAYPGELI